MSVACLSVFAAAILGVLIATGDTGDLAVVLGLACAGWIVSAAPPGVALWITIAGCMVAPTWWPPLASVGGADLTLGDSLVGVGVATALVRGRGPALRPAVVALGVLYAVALVHSDREGLVALGRLLLPVAVLLLLSRALSADYDVWRAARWVPIAIAASVVFTDGFTASRWSSWAGGPNETALLAAVGLVLGFAQTSMAWRAALLSAGVVMLLGTQAITGTVAAVAGLVTYTLHPRLFASGRAKASPIVVLWIGVTAALVLPLLRANISGTVDAHLLQLRTLPDLTILGAGWGNVDTADFVFSDIVGLHNVYFDVFAYLGLVGFGVFAWLLVRLLSTADPLTRSVLVVWLVWVNTTGAFPGPAWGVLGFVVAAAALGQRSRRQQLAVGEPARPVSMLDLHQPTVDHVSGQRG